MQSIPYLKPAAGYTDALTLGPYELGKSVTITIDAKGPAIFQLGRKNALGKPYWDEEEITLTGVSTGFDNCTGIKFRYGDPANIPTVAATLFLEGDPIPTGTTPFNFALTPQGGIISLANIPSIALANFPPANPVDGQTYELILPASYDPVGGKSLGVLVTFDANQALWHCAPVPLQKLDGTHLYVYAGAGFFVDPSGTLTGVTPFTVPRPGLYRAVVSIVGIDPATGGAHDLTVNVYKNAVGAGNAIGIGNTFESVAGLLDERTQIAGGDVVCNANDTLGIQVICGVNNVEWQRAMFELTPKWIT